MGELIVMLRNILCISGMVLLAGCGGSAEAPDDETAVAETSDPSAEAEATASPAIASPKVDCGDFKGETAPKGQPADDILGVRQGMTLAQVQNVLQCKNSSYAVNTNERSVSLPSGGQMSQIDLSADSGLDKVNATFVGPSGSEQLVHVDRTIEFTEGKELPVASIKQELADKYGAFDTSKYYKGDRGEIVRSRDGQQLSSGNSSYSVCQRQGVQLQQATPCLFAVSYSIQRDDENPELASKFSVNITNHAKAWAMVEAGERQLSADVQRAKEKVSEGGLNL
ncbi:hypothetical protein GCM10011494_10050 [Novosphingobium endophyticum]|uniref:Uncharacterized protein n=1 Tax=Novosphingobium endophyticum TaxID=1955250 RepID=A0A916TQ67_9SPHN|nr:hypothetical protein [Novosphingobium endophyticum]GGB93624.1 hypothetical protein GCM10011494_10050 [Novosphingobium endophyticum]